MRHSALSLSYESVQRWGYQGEIVFGQADAWPLKCPWVLGGNIRSQQCIREYVDAFASLVRGYTDVGLAYAYPFDVPMIGRQHHFKPAID